MEKEALRLKPDRNGASFFFFLKKISHAKVITAYE